MKEIGLTIKCGEVDYLIGLMEENIKENMSMIKKMDLEFIIYQMEQNMKECGKMDIKKDMA